MDISELKRREKEATLARQVLQSVFDNLSDGVLLYETDGRWVYQNPAMARLHAMSDAKLAELPTFGDIVRYRARRGCLFLGSSTCTRTFPSGCVRSRTAWWVTARIRTLMRVSLRCARFS